VEIRSVTDSNAVQALIFSITSVAMVLSNFGMVVMTKERADERNRQLAMQDELTGLSNRRHIQEALTRQLAQALRSGRPLALLMIDIDHFKRINDSYGHLSGDQACASWPTAYGQGGPRIWRAAGRRGVWWSCPRPTPRARPCWRSTCG
jgi:hypothetical protein